MKKTFLKIFVLTLIVNTFFLPITVSAGSLSSISDTMSRLKVSEASNHTITFTQSASTSWAASETLTLTFATGFGLTSLANTDPLDYDINVGGTDETIVAASGCSTNDAISITSIVGQVITFTACSSYTAGSSGAVITIEIGTNATNGGTGDTQITNPSSTGSKTISIGGNFGDTGSLAVGIVTNDQLSVTATVDPTLTFIITDNSVPLGTLSSTAATTATETFQVATNGDSGYYVTYSGTTLTHSNASDTITALSSGGTSSTNTEQFGINLKDNSSPDVGAEASGGSGAAASGYATVNNFRFVSGETIASASGPSATTTFTISFLANIGAQTEAGAYSTTLTLIATGQF